MTGVERAMALDLLDESPIDRLHEDEDGIFTEAEATLDFTDVPDYMHGFAGIAEAGAFWVTGEEF